MKNHMEANRNVTNVRKLTEIKEKFIWVLQNKSKEISKDKYHGISPSKRGKTTVKILVYLYLRYYFISTDLNMLKYLNIFN